MTEKLYNKSAYIKEFDAVVISCEKVKNGYEVLLDKTAFFPEGGGQSSDVGYINGIAVFDVKELEKNVYHYTKNALNVNESVHCAIDFEKRFEKMQCHTAEHIVSGLLHNIYGIENVGFHLGGVDVTLDTSVVVTREMLDRIEMLANDAVYRNVPITVKYPLPDELADLNYRSKLELTEDVRIVDIDGYDSCACCAPHVSFTGEIGIIKFLDSVKHKAGSRIRMLAGKRAYDYIKKISDEASGVSVLLSSPITDIKSETERLLSAKANIEYKLSQMGRETAVILAENLAIHHGNAVLCYPMLNMDALRVFANIAHEKVEGTLVALTGNEGDYRYILMNSSEAFREIVSDANAALGGKGGGRAPMACGTYTAPLSQIKAYFDKK